MFRALKVRQIRNDSFKITFPPKNEQTNSTLLLWYLRSPCFSSFFWKKSKTPKNHFEINYTLAPLSFYLTWPKLSVSLTAYHLSNIYWLELDLLGIRGLEQGCKTWFFLWHAYVPSSRYECMWFCINKNQLWQPRAWKMTWQRRTMIFFYSYNNEPGQVWSRPNTHPTFKIQFSFKWA